MRWQGPIGAAVLTGVGTTAWAVAETRRFGVLEVTVPLGQGPLRILHLSDLHLTPRQGRKIAWLRTLAELEPDLTIVTGDFLGHRAAVPVVLDALEGLLHRPGAFVLGSNDYYAPRTINPFAYLSGPSELRDSHDFLPWGDLVAGLRAAGWLDLNNAQGQLLGAALRGVDDPHIRRDKYHLVAGAFPAGRPRIGVAHAPYRRVLDAFAADGADLILAGHTHGGQVCLPGGRAIVTNCDLDAARASGLSGYQHSFLHVSQGIGTAPTAPIRLFCPPRATLLTVT